MRGVSSFALVALALTACAPEKEKDGKDGTPLPLGIELASAAAAASSETEPAVIDVSVEELRERLETGHTVLIDVRTDEEVAEGMIESALHIPMDEFDPAKLEISQYDRALFYCRSGRRSRIVAEQYSAYTGEPEQHLEGGIIAWNDAQRGE